MKPIPNKQAYELPVSVSGYSSWAEVIRAIGSEPAALDRLNQLILVANPNLLKNAVVKAAFEVTGTKSEEGESGVEYVARVVTDENKEAVKAKLAASTVTLDIKPAPHKGRVAAIKPVPPKWLAKAKKQIEEKVLPKGPQGVPQFEAYLKSKGFPAWLPDMTKPLAEGENLEKLGRIVQVAHVNPL